jgi:MOSC domain-containing protein YiiM
MSTPILALLAGKVVTFANGEMSAIAKSPVEGRVRIGFLGIESDEQADKRVHGGPDKALHHHPAENYAYWGQIAVDHPLLNAPGTFGENISTWGLTEDQVCIGDRFRCGNAVLEISQGRQPCWKQAQRLNWPALPKMMVQERRSGWYYRVIEEGDAQEGDTLELLERPLPEWSVKRVFGLLIAGDWKREPQALPYLRDMDLLFGGWRQHAVDLMEARGQ